jgi:ACS family hexuronate transporter-like MFS transporter
LAPDTTRLYDEGAKCTLGTALVSGYTAEANRELIISRPADRQGTFGNQIVARKGTTYLYKGETSLLTAGVMNEPAPTLSLPRFRWIICALLFFATTINYVDRQLLGILAPTLQREIGWNEIEYASLVTSFQLAYAMGLVCFGWLIDRIGTRMGLLLAVGAWSIASLAHGFVATVAGFAAARFALGLAEAGNFPASIKTVSEWFPARERAFAIGIFNSGANIGAILTPLVVPWIAMAWGWRAAFLVSGIIGVVWIIAAIPLLYPPFRSPHISSSHLTALRGNEAEAAPRVSWRALATRRETWAFAIAKLLTDPIWWFFLYWAPKYINSQFHVELAGLAAPLVLIYLMADIGSIAGGWASARLIQAGMEPLSARRRIMLWCAIAPLSVIFAAHSPSMWLSALLIGIATAAHQGWSANLFATIADLFKKEEVASVVGIGGMLGAIGGMIIATVTGFILEFTGSYTVPFIMCGSAYLIAWLVFSLIVRNAASRQ